MVEDETVLRAYSQTRKMIERKRARLVFFTHLGAYVLGNIALGAWNAYNYFVNDSPELWFFLPLLFWGVGVIIHFLNGVALFEEWWDYDERTIQQRFRG